MRSQVRSQPLASWPWPAGPGRRRVQRDLDREPGRAGGGAGSASARRPSPSSDQTPGGPLASCVAGDWRSTGVSGTAEAGTASARLDGGGGVAFKVGPAGETTVDFTGMQPVAFTVAVGGTDVVGSFTYAGTVTGTIQTSGGAAGTSGVWEPGRERGLGADPGDRGPDQAGAGVPARHRPDRRLRRLWRQPDGQRRRRRPAARHRGGTSAGATAWCSRRTRTAGVLTWTLERA